MTIFYFVLAALALGILVFIHELGHYIVAKKTGMIVETFSIGFGRPLLKWQWQGVAWQVGWLPFGGYVKILGMEVSKTEDREPYEIPNGFFAKAPWKRILVAAAGPVANFVLALIIFCIIWSMGGRQKPFSDYTHIVGWVDPQSEVFAQGLRPGDEIKTYNGKSFTGAKDLLYAAMLSGKEVKFTGEHVDAWTGTQTPFEYQVTPYAMIGGLDGLETTGVLATARYLIYNNFPHDQPNDLVSGSPMAESGIELGDRLVWADGELLFSMEQLSALANGSAALLTVQRGDQIFLSKQPRVQTTELIFPSYVRNELEDWRYAAHVPQRFNDLYVLPYVVNEEGYVESPLTFIDEQNRLIAFPKHSYTPSLQHPLEAGDRILAIDGRAVTTGIDMLTSLQTHRVQMIVQKGISLEEQGSFKEADNIFHQAWDVAAIAACVQHVGRSTSPVGEYRLLTPVEPQPILTYTRDAHMRTLLEEDYRHRMIEIEKMKDFQHRDLALQTLAAGYQKKLFGISLQDRLVCFNPNPFVQFQAVFTETWQTLKALVMGYLHPKWLSGPVGIVRVIHHGWLVGVQEALFWMGAISINLGFLNLLPIPVLDGGYICLSLWEWITGRRLKAKTMERIIVPFVVLLIGLLVFLTFQDVLRLF